MNPTIIFMFAGRQANMELQLPYLRRILAQHPNTELHIWDLSRTLEDHAYIRSLRAEDRITVMQQFYDGRAPWLHFNKVWKHYTDPAYSDHRFVKIDDDVVFLETHRFGAFIDSIDAHPNAIVSAKVINNGACTTTEPELWAGFQALGIPLLDVHTSTEYADMCHRWFFDHWHDTIGGPATATPTQDWLSINVIGFNWRVCRQLTRQLGRPSPPIIAGRRFTPRAYIGDEGSANMLPRYIHHGFVAAHLTFGPQEIALTDGQLDEYRKLYADIARQYLG